MAKAILYNISKTKITILFQSHIDTTSFEILLKQTYSRVKSESFTHIHFDLSKVHWFESFQLSQFALWIQELAESKKTISLTLPDSSRVIAYFNSFKFLSFLKEKRIITDQIFDDRINKENRFQPFFPLTFADNKKFSDLINSLGIDDYYNVIFEEVRNAAVTKKGIIRDIILKEIGDNMYYHANGKYANFLMTKINTKALKYDSVNSPFENDFLNNVRGTPYVEMIISDKGPGIAATLRDSYLKHYNLPDNTKVDECDIIEYATIEDSTSRTPKERLKHLLDQLSKELEHIVPFTGLFQVKETVKKYKGLLMIRSGKSIVSFNYLIKDINQRQILKSSGVRSYTDLAAFGGTQIRILLPTFTDFETEATYDYNFTFKEVDKKISYSYFSLSDVIDVPRIRKLNLKQVENYSDLLVNIKKVINSKNKNGVIVDCLTVNHIDSKLLFVLVCELMVFQRNYSVVISMMNFPSSLIEIIKDSLDSKKDFEKTPIIIYNQEFKRIILGLSEQDRLTLLEIPKVKVFDQQRHITFANKYPHLFFENKELGAIQLRYNKNQILKTCIDSIETRIKDYIYDTSNNIYHKEKRILTASGQYSSVYYEIFKLISSKYMKPFLLNWLGMVIQIEKPNCIVSINKYCSNLIEEFLYNQSDNYIDHYSITPTNYESITSYIRLKNIGKKTLMFSDVIASGKTLRSILLEFDFPDTIVALTITNLLGKEYITIGEKNIKIKSVVLEKVDFNDSLPGDWNYEELLTIDRENYTLKSISKHPFIYTQLNDERSIVKKYAVVKELKEVNNQKLELHSNKFFDSIILPNRAYFLKVFTRQGYMPIMYNVNLILELVGEEVVHDIINNIYKIEFSEKIKFSHVVHIDYVNNPFRPLIKSLLKTYPSIEIESITQNHLQVLDSSDDSHYYDGVVIIDDAFNSGENLYKLIEYCESRSAKYIYCYVLIKRGSEDKVKRLQKLKQFGHATVTFNYVFEGQLPFYPGLDNPISANHKSIQNLETLFNNYPYKSFLAMLNMRNTYTYFYDMEIFQEKRDASSSIIMRWKLELAKKYIGFNKEISFIFEDSAKYRTEILEFFEILEHEKEAFLVNDATRKFIFYSKFSEKILDTIGDLLFNENSSLSALNIYDLLTTQIYLDPESFSQLIVTMDAELLLHEKTLYPLITVLNLYPNNNHRNNLRTLFQKRATELKISMVHNEFDIEFFKSLNTFWNIENGNAGRLDIELRAKAIKGLLKTSFHDFLEVAHYIKSKRPSGNIEKLKSSWRTVVEMCSESIEYFHQLFKHQFSEDVKMSIFPILKTIHNNVNIGNNAIAALSRSSSTHDFSTLEFDIIKATKNIEEAIFDNGLLTIIENNFRIEIKQILRVIIDRLSEVFIVEKNITEDACNVFFSEIDFIRTVSNIAQNILQHSNSTQILIDVSKTKVENVDKIAIRFYENGEAAEIIFGKGLQTCQDLCETYSGSFLVQNKQGLYTYNGISYNICNTIILHDLSKEILIKPSYAQEDYTGN